MITLNIFLQIFRSSLGDRVSRAVDPEITLIGGLGNRQMVFSTERKQSRGSKKRQEEMKQHREDRKKVIRPTTSLKFKKLSSKF